MSTADIETVRRYIEDYGPGSLAALASLARIEARLGELEKELEFARKTTAVIRGGLVENLNAQLAELTDVKGRLAQAEAALRDIQEDSEARVRRAQNPTAERSRGKAADIARYFTTTEEDEYHYAEEQKELE